jgi:hypothetical protein
MKSLNLHEPPLHISVCVAYNPWNPSRLILAPHAARAAREMSDAEIKEAAKPLSVLAWYKWLHDVDKNGDFTNVGVSYVWYGTI